MRAFITRPHKFLLAAAVTIPLILFFFMMWHNYSSLLYYGIFFGAAVIVQSILAVAVNRHAKREQAATEALKAVNSELKAAHEQAENRKRLLEAVMDALPIGLAITDTQGGTIDSNSAFEQIWSGPRPKTLSVDDYGAYRAWWVDTGEPVGQDEWASAKAVKNGETVVGQMMRLQRFDGSETFVINSASPIRDTEGRIVGSAVAIQDISDIKKIDAELRTAKEEWERTFDSVPDLIAILDTQHRIVRVNQAMANQLNLEPSRCVGLPCFKAIHGTHVPPSFCPHSRSLNDLEEHESLVEETVFGGTFLVSTTPLFNRDGEMYASVHVARDITRLSQIEKELRENEERLRLLGDNLPESAVYQYAHELDGSVRFLYLSAGIEQLNGISVEALLQDAGRLYRQIAPEYLARFWEAEAKSARELSDLDMEVPMHRPDGEMRWMQLHSRPRRFPDGRIVWDGVQTDITGRKQAESLLREKDARLQFHLNNSPMAVIEWDSDFNVLSWTGESEQLFGWSAAEAVGKPFTALQMVVEEDMSIVAATMARLTDGVTRQVVLTNRNYTKEGDIRHCTWYNSVLMTQEGKITSVLSQVIDITKRIAVENELLKARSELEERVRERTQALEAAVEILQVEIEERKRAEAALEKSAHEIEDLYNLAPCGYHSLDKEGTFVRVNDTELQWLGYGRDEIIGKLKAADIMTPESRAVFSRDFAAFKAGGNLSDLKLFFLRKNGSVLPVLLNSIPILDSNGDYLMSRSTIYDITDLVRAEASVHRLNLLYRTLSETGKAIASLPDRARLFREICRIAVEFGNFRMAWVGLLDGASGEVRPVAVFGAGKEYLDKIRISTRKEPEGMGPTGRAVREGSYYICNNFQNDASTAPWQVEAERHGFRSSAAMSIRLHGEPIGAITIYAAEADYFDNQVVELLVQMQTDLCFALDNLNREESRRAAEKKLQAETQQRLEAVEALRRQELVLIQQSRHAAMGEMIGNIAHQWRQPLNTLGLFTQRLGIFYGSAEFNKEFLDTSVAKSMEIIQYMSHTIDDFRSFFSTDREKTEFSIDGAVTKALSLVEAGFRERMIRVEREGTEDVRIYGFPNEYAQVLLNIFINAKDVINERNVQSPLVKINLATADGSSLLTISDNAGGIPEDTIDKIFDPYFSSKGPQQGTGLGLFMSKTIIENNMGGRLTVCNTDEGAEFRIEV